MSFSFAATQQQQVSALHIPNNLVFLSAKDCYHLVWEPRLCRYGSDTIFWIYGCWYDYCINAYDCQASQNWTSKCRCLEDENAVASQRTESFFFIFDKREARRSGANGFFNQVMLCCCSQTTKESIWTASIVVDSKKKVLRSCANGGQG